MSSAQLSCAQAKSADGVMMMIVMMKSSFAYVHRAVCMALVLPDGQSNVRQTTAQCQFSNHVRLGRLMWLQTCVLLSFMLVFIGMPESGSDKPISNWITRIS